MNRAPRLRAVACTATIALVLAACGSSPAPSATTSGSAPGGSASPVTSQPPASQVDRIVLAHNVDDGQLNWYLWNTAFAFEMVKWQYDTLVQFDTHSVPQPWLATSWEQSADGATWTFKLRDDVRWHDGEALTADDVVFSIEYAQAPALKPKSHCTYAAGGWTAASSDPTTVAITTPAADPDLLIKLNQCLIVPKHIWDGVGTGDDTEAAIAEITALKDNTGSGPYKLTSYEASKGWTLVANDDYFLGPPAVKEVIISLIPDPTARGAALQAGEIDSTTLPFFPEAAREFEGKAPFTVNEGKLFAQNVMYLNQEKPALADPVVREALALSIDQAELIEVARLGWAVPGSQGWVHPVYDVAVPDLTLTYDPEKAKGILDAAGYVDTDGDGVREYSDGTPLTFEVLSWTTFPDLVRAADLLAESAAPVGIKIVSAPLDIDTALAQTEAGDFDLSMNIWGFVLMSPPSAGLTKFFHSDPAKGFFNYGHYKSAEMDALLDEIVATGDIATRTDLMAQVQRLAAKDHAMITLWYPNNLWIFDPAKYAGWRSIDGLGYTNKLTFLPQALP